MQIWKKKLSKDISNHMNLDHNYMQINNLNLPN